MSWLHLSILSGLIFGTCAFGLNSALAQVSPGEPEQFNPTAPCPGSHTVALCQQQLKLGEQLSPEQQE